MKSAPRVKRKHGVWAMPERQPQHARSALVGRPQRPVPRAVAAVLAASSSQRRLELLGIFL